MPKRPTKEDAIDSLLSAMDAMQQDPELEEVDTLGLMEQAISDALQHLTGKIKHTRDLQKKGL